MSIRTPIGFLIVSFLFLTHSHAFADGKVFSRAVAAPVKTPDQQAMLYFSNGVERLVIETSFVGEGTNFAWVVPLPSAPKIEAVSTNFFKTLNASFQPKLIYEITGGWFWVPALGAAASLAIWSRRKGRWAGGCLAVALLFMLLAVAILPMFVRSRGYALHPAAKSSVAVLGEQQVGIYDTVTISGNDGRELLDWLNQKQFRVPTNALSVISDYAKEKWVFAVARINQASAKIVATRPHPLAFTFQTERSVYPLRLTGVENETCSIALFVFGPSRAEADGFKVEHCGHPSAPVSGDDLVRKEFLDPPAPGEYRIAGPDLQRWATPAAVITKLTGELRAKEMQSDASIRWTDFQATLPVFYTEDAAFASALTWATCVVVLGGLAVQLLGSAAAPTARRKLMLGILLAGIACGCGRRMMIEATPTVLYRGSWYIHANDFRVFDGAIQQFALEQTPARKLTADEFLIELRHYIGRESNIVMNTFHPDVPMKNEPSPGNITIDRTPDTATVLWYDINGASHVMATFTNAPK
jgi:hypothetical protein